MTHANEAPRDLASDSDELYNEVIVFVIEQGEPVSARTVNDELVFGETGAKASSLLRRAANEGKLSRHKGNSDRNFRYASPDYDWEEYEMLQEMPGFVASNEQPLSIEEVGRHFNCDDDGRVAMLLDRLAEQGEISKATLYGKDSYEYAGPDFNWRTYISGCRAREAEAKARERLLTEVVTFVIDQANPVSADEVNKNIIHSSKTNKASALLRQAAYEGRLSRDRVRKNASFEYARPDYDWKSYISAYDAEVAAMAKARIERARRSSGGSNVPTQLEVTKVSHDTGILDVASTSSSATHQLNEASPEEGRGSCAVGFWTVIAIVCAITLALALAFSPAALPFGFIAAIAIAIFVINK